MSAVRSLRDLPKAHLHAHLEGCMRPATLEELAQEHGMEVPSTTGYGDFTAFSAMYVAACAVLRRPEDLARLVHEVAEDAAKDGAVWVEPSFEPHLHVPTFGSVETVIDIIAEAGAAAARALGIGVGFMVAGDRTADPAAAVQSAVAAVKYVDRGVVSFGLDNDEVIGPPEGFAEAFTVARDGGLLSTPHAGELVGPESVISALDKLQPNRILHGVRAIEDPALVDRLASADICLDVCPTSNILLSVAPSYDKHPLGALLDAGVACSVNADDSLLFGPGLLDEYQLCREVFGFDDERMAAIATASVMASGAPDDSKTAATAAIAAWRAGDET